MPDLTPAEQRTTRRLLVTGSRDWTDARALREALRQAWVDLGGLEVDVVLVHGDCPTGADRMADQEWATWGRSIEAHPADWRQGKWAGPHRNQQMVDLGADLCLAFPLGESRGTRHCMTAARRAGIPVRVIAPARAALDGDTDQCGDPGCDDEHGGGA